MNTICPICKQAHTSSACLPVQGSFAADVLRLEAENTKLRAEVERLEKANFIAGGDLSAALLQLSDAMGRLKNHEFMTKATADALSLATKERDDANRQNSELKADKELFEKRWNDTVEERDAAVRLYDELKKGIDRALTVAATNPSTSIKTLDAVVGVLLALVERPVCEHRWVDARNEFVKSGELCLKCLAIRAGNSTTDEKRNDECREGGNHNYEPGQSETCCKCQKKRKCEVCKVCGGDLPDSCYAKEVNDDEGRP